MKTIIIIIGLFIGGVCYGATPTPVPTSTPAPTPTPVIKPRPGTYIEKVLPFKIDETGKLHKQELSTTGVLWTIEK